MTCVGRKYYDTKISITWLGRKYVVLRLQSLMDGPIDLYSDREEQLAKGFRLSNQPVCLLSL